MRVHAPLTLDPSLLCSKVQKAALGLLALFALCDYSETGGASDEAQLAQRSGPYCHIYWATAAITSSTALFAQRDYFS